MRVGRVVATIGLILAGLIAAPTAFAGAGALISSTTSITSTSPNPIVDEPISVAVNVSGSDGGIPTGTVTVSDGTNTSDPCTLDSSGDAICAITETSAGPETLTATYGGDGNYDVSSTSTSVSVADLPAVLVTGNASGPDVSVGDVLTEDVTFDDSPGYDLGACTGTAQEAVVSNPESPGTATLNLTGIDFTSCTGTSTIAGITSTTLASRGHHEYCQRRRWLGFNQWIHTRRWDETPVSDSLDDRICRQLVERNQCGHIRLSIGGRRH